MAETQQTEEKTEEKKETVKHVKGQPHPVTGRGGKPIVRAYQEEDKKKITPLSKLKSAFHPTRTVEYPTPDGDTVYIPIKNISQGDSTIINDTAMITSVRRLVKQREEKIATTDAAIEAGRLDEYLEDIRRENEYIRTLVAGGLAYEDQDLEWNELDEYFDEACIMFLFTNIIGGAVPADGDNPDRVDQFLGEDGTNENGSEPEAPTN